MRFFISRLLLFISALIASIETLALETHNTEPPLHASSAELTQNAIRQNQKNRAARRSLPRARPSLRLGPVEDFAHFRYLLISGSDTGPSESEFMRKTLAENLPKDMILIVIADTSDLIDVEQKFQQWIDPQRLIVVPVPQGEARRGFWARDSFPIPIYLENKSKIGLIENEYFNSFGSQSSISQAVRARFAEKTNMIFVGGNLLADEDGNCFSVKSSRLFSLTPDELRNYYGCQAVHLLPHEKGIGDIDEVLKPLPGKNILTNVPSYIPLLKSWGYNVVLLPEVQSYKYRTYANTVLLNGVAFMPSYGDPQDDEARKVYESLGYQVHMIPSNQLSDRWMGSIHCQTMAFPDMDLKILLKTLHLSSL